MCSRAYSFRGSFTDGKEAGFIMGVLSQIKSAVRRIVRPKVVIGAVNHRCSMERLGSEYGGWAIHPDLIRNESVVYSFGVGEDITWDLAMIERFGVKVHAFDPTPKSISYIKSRNLSPDSFVMHEFGLAEIDGEIKFYAPENPAHVSLSVHERPKQVPTMILPVRRLSTIMQGLGHERIDILKMDIEGSEYGAIENILSEGIQISQLLIEYHHRFETVGNAKTEASLALLEKHGFKLFCISDSAEEYSFVKPAQKGRVL